MARFKGRSFNIVSTGTLDGFLVIHLLLLICQVAYSVTFKGIPAAFGDLDLNKRTDIVVIGDDGTRIDIYYQHQRQILPPSSCKSHKPVVQVYLADIDSDGNPNLLPLLLVEQNDRGKIYELKSLKVESIDPISSIALTPNTAYTVAIADALNGDVSNSSNNGNSSMAESLPLKQGLRPCDFSDLGVEMSAQPLLFDLEGDLRTEFMSLDRRGVVSVWKPPKPGSNSEHFEKMPEKDWNWISKEYFSEPHSNAFIDINRDDAADIVLSANNAKIAYLYADPDPTKSFRKHIKEFSEIEDKNYNYGQSSLVDLDADGKIDHVLPRCRISSSRCEIIVLFDNNRREVIFKFDNITGDGDVKYSYEYQLDREVFATNYMFPITLRASDLDGDGFTDFVVIAKNNKDGKNKVVYLHNVPDTSRPKYDNYVSGVKTMTRTFEVQEIPSSDPSQNIHFVTLFDINEDGKVDMLIGAGEQHNKPDDMNISAKMNTQMVDACFMKVLVTNGYCSEEAGSNGLSARGPSICFELSQNDGKKLQGCAGQLSQSSYFALLQPYVIFGLGQTPHFVETLNVSIPGFGSDGRVRTRMLEQIVPDAQVIIIPKNRDGPNSWDYKMFLSPMSEMVFSTLIALAVLCLIILFIIFILHRQETLEDAAEHEEYKRHWPESR